ncbi:MAG: Uncharacterized protein XD92_0069 [Proteiniphilum acetatigenes]|uniref:Uncharacterized protein n=1 Tax=Proteiniphilum acetatigenes TaxID=294710 RepID=A0A101HKY5_9BACT|nr:MAG: Uncharacterized protein XD92_0069 [Proteiniphilum acetatigenes]HCC85993.1 hypothetical protein [Porphyromonadaceae bacterium]
MRKNRDKTKELLEELVTELYREANVVRPAFMGDAYLLAGDGQYLGKITSNKSDPDAITNPYGRYGSRYSPFSIFNPSSPYGSREGALSIHNPHATTPPELYLQGKPAGRVTANKELPDAIDSEQFLRQLKSDPDAIWKLL